MKVDRSYLIYGLIIVVVGLVLYTILSSGRKGKVESEDVKVEIRDQPRAAVTPQGSVTFCFRLNGREDMHLPALLGSAGSNVYPNGLAGFNWSLLPESSGSEAYGILADGTIFVKEEFLLQWNPNKVEIKSDQTGWMAIEMKKGEVNGKKAYIY